MKTIYTLENNKWVKNGELTDRLQYGYLNGYNLVMLYNDDLQPIGWGAY